MSESIIDAARRFAVDHNLQLVAVLIRIRDQIGRDDVEAWNALTYAAFQLRVAADAVACESHVEREG